MPNLQRQADDPLARPRLPAQAFNSNLPGGCQIVPGLVLEAIVRDLEVLPTPSWLSLPRSG